MQGGLLNISSVPMIFHEGEGGGGGGATTVVKSLQIHITVCELNKSVRSLQPSPD